MVKYVGNTKYRALSLVREVSRSHSYRIRLAALGKVVWGTKKVGLVLTRVMTMMT